MILHQQVFVEGIEEVVIEEFLLDQRCQANVAMDVRQNIIVVDILEGYDCDNVVLEIVVC